MAFHITTVSYAVIKESPIDYISHVYTPIGDRRVNESLSIYFHGGVEFHYYPYNERVKGQTDLEAEFYNLRALKEPMDYFLMYLENRVFI